MIINSMHALIIYSIQSEILQYNKQKHKNEKGIIMRLSKAGNTENQQYYKYPTNHM